MEDRRRKKIEDQHCQQTFVEEIDHNEIERIEVSENFNFLIKIYDK